MRLQATNLQNYINSKYPGAEYICARTMFYRPYYLQKDFGGLNDCTLMSISYAYKMAYPNKDINAIYNKVEAAAKKFFYNDKIGTIPFFINNIISKAFNINSQGKLVKNVGFNPSTIIKALEKGKIVILSMFSDGNNYFKNHSVSVVGYKKYKHNGRYIYFFEVRDNWNSFSSYVDYQTMSCVSSINYLG